MAWAWSKIAAGQVPGGPAAGLVLLRLADLADPEGKCWPGHQRTAADLNLAESTVRTSIKGLEMAGLMEIKPREIDGRCASNLYILAVDNLDSQPCDRVPKSGTRVPKNAGMGVPKSGTDVLVDTLCARGNQIDYRLYEGADHRQTIGASLSDIQSFVSAVETGAPAADGC